MDAYIYHFQDDDYHDLEDLQRQYNKEKLELNKIVKYKDLDPVNLSETDKF